MKQSKMTEEEVAKQCALSDVNKYLMENDAGMVLRKEVVTAKLIDELNKTYAHEDIQEQEQDY